MRSDRLLSLLLMLQTRGRVTAPQAARELEVSVRTIYRYVESLGAAGVPVWSEQGRSGGISLMPGYTTDMTGLTAQESRALVALTGRAVPNDLGLGTALDSAVHKLIAAVPTPHRDAAEQARQRVLVDHTGWYRSADPVPHLAVVQDAVWQGRRLRIRYRHGDGRLATYLLDPYGLVVKAGTWYLVGVHRRRERLWRVDRVQRAEPRPDAARHRDVDLAEAWHRLRAQVERPGEPMPVTVRVRAEALPMLLRMTRSQRPPGHELDAGAAPPPDDHGWVQLELEFRAERAAVGLLLGFGGAVEVLAPRAVRDLMRTTALAALARHQE